MLRLITVTSGAIGDPSQITRVAHAHAQRSARPWHLLPEQRGLFEHIANLTEERSLFPSPK